MSDHKKIDTKAILRRLIVKKEQEIEQMNRDRRLPVEEKKLLLEDLDDELQFLEYLEVDLSDL